MYYILGLIFTDGNLNKGENKITLSLTQKDVIEKIYPYFCSKSRKIYEYKPKYKNAKNIYTIINTNKNAILKLKELSLTPNNSLTKKFPNIPNDWIYSFIRGVFDGNGCIFIARRYKDKIYKKISISCGSYYFVKELYDILIRLKFNPTICIDSRTKNKKGHTLYYLCINRQKEIELFRNYIYNNANIYIKYKKQKFE